MLLGVRTSGIGLAGLPGTHQAGRPEALLDPAASGERVAALIADGLIDGTAALRGRAFSRCAAGCSPTM